GSIHDQIPTPARHAHRRGRGAGTALLGPDVLRLGTALRQGRRRVVLAYHLVAGVALHRPEPGIPDQVQQVLPVHGGGRAVGVRVVGDLVLHDRAVEIVHPEVE